jgi:hypothetical protein
MTAIHFIDYIFLSRFAEIDLRVKLPHSTFPHHSPHCYLRPHSAQFSAIDTDLGAAHPSYLNVIHFDIDQSNLKDMMETADLRDLI